MATRASRMLPLLTLFLLLRTDTVTGQVTAALKPGDTVRVQRWAPASPVEGTLRGLSATHLAVEPEASGKTLLIRREDAWRIQVRGTRRPWLKGAGLGALIGGGTLALAGFADGDDECSGWCFFTLSAEEKAVLGLVTGGVLGGVTGLVVGALVKTRTWKPVPPEKVWISPEISSGGGMGLRIRLPVR